MGQRALILAIRGYRRYLSGRGPLRRMVCTFAGPPGPAQGPTGESCSSYGLRVAHTAPGLWAALRLIRGRLRRCGDACLYRHPVGLLFGPLYDDLADSPALLGQMSGEDPAPARLLSQLQAAQEQPAAVALVLRSARSPTSTPTRSSTSSPRRWRWCCARPRRWHGPAERRSGHLPACGWPGS